MGMGNVVQKARLSLGLVLVLAGCGAEPGAGPQQPAGNSQPPNILLIVLDDLGYTDLGAFGGEIATPHLDGLARAGVRFTNFHAAPSCAPTRAMLMTGTDHHLAGMGSQAGLETPRQKESRAYRSKLLPDVPTVAEHLRDLGYRNLASAKWHLGDDADALPNARGFHRSFVLLQGGASHFDATPLFPRYGQAEWREDDEFFAVPEGFYSTDFMTDKLLEYIGETPLNQPYFAYLGYTAPHWPLHAPEEAIAEYRGRYDAGFDVLRAERMAGARREGVVAAHAQAVHHEAGMLVWDELNEAERRAQTARMEVYAAMVDRVDDNVGRVLTALRERGDLDTTLIVFMADNGAEAHVIEARDVVVEWIRTRPFDNAPASIGTAESYVTLGPSWARAGAAPFRASKSKISEGGIRVPAFVSLPRPLRAASGRIDDSYMRVMDLAPTFIDLAGGAVPGSMMGRSLLPRWGGGVPAYADDEVIAGETYGRRMAQRGHWKVLLQEAPYGTGEWQLYDLAADPGEQQDLSEERPALRAELIDAWSAYADEVGVILPETPVRY